jgi:hypothetical protein
MIKNIFLRIAEIHENSEESVNPSVSILSGYEPHGEKKREPANNRLGNHILRVTNYIPQNL